MSAVSPVIASLASWTLWRRGELSDLLLDQTQQEIHSFIINNPSLQVYVLGARQLGKSFACLTLACEICLKNPGGRVNYCGKTLISVKAIVEGSMKLIVESAPEDCKPVFMQQKSRWVFPNGAFIQLVGADEYRGADRLRGPRVIANFIDEAGFLDCLEYLLNSVLKPMTRRSRARTVLLSTPAHSPGHYSCEVEDAGHRAHALILRDIWSPGMQSREDKLRFLEQEALSRNLTLAEYMETTDFRREYLCERVIEQSLAIVPEFPKVKDLICLYSIRPEFFDYYISIDPGMADKTGILFAFRDFKRAKTVIEHELLLDQANTSTLASAIKKVLTAEYPVKSLHQPVWTFRDPHSEPQSCQAPRVAVVDDSGKRLSADLFNDHRLQFSPARKDDSAAAINQMRLAIGNRELEINPRCENLIRQLSTAVRKKQGGDMARTKRDGHFDLVAALKYLLRAVDKDHNPFPDNHGFSHANQARRELPSKSHPLTQALLAGTHVGRRLVRR